jgi:hypothetical protein
VNLKAFRAYVTDQIGACDIAADSEVEMAAKLQELITDAIYQRRVVIDVTRNYVELATLNKETRIETDAGTFNMLDWTLQEYKNATVATVA